MSKLQEKNNKVIARCLETSPEVVAMKKYFAMKFNGEDPIGNTEKWNFIEGQVSLSKLRTKLEEADSASAFTQFLRAGINQVAANMYKATPVTYTEWATVIQSQKDTEIFAPNHGVAFPREVGRQEIYPEVGAAALDLELKHKKYGSIYALEKELLNDDQSGSFAQQSAMLGEYLAIVAEVWSYGKLASVAGMKYLDLQIPTSETKPSYEASYPWSTALRGGGATKGASYSAFTQASFQAARVALMNQKNLQGIKMLVDPKRVICGTNNELDVKTTLNSSFYPQGAGSAGANFGAFAVNVLKGVADVTVSRFMFKNDGTVDGSSKAWYLVDDSKPFFVVSMREPISVEMEAPNSGKNFEQDIIRYKGSTRMNADFIDPRFAFIGNDGSV